MTAWVFFILLLSGSKSQERQTAIQSYASLSKTSLFLMQNMSTFIETTSERKTAQNASKKSYVHEAQLLSHRLQSVIPPFAVTSKNVKNAQCKRDSEMFLEHLSQLDLWALQMYDSSGKVPSGLLNGNINQFGDFDQCVNIHETSMNLKGKYCLAYLQVRISNRHESTFQAYKLMQSHFMFKSKLTDPGHRIPRFSTINWGLCVPSSCSSQDVETHLREVVNKYSNGTGFDVEVKVDSEMCQEKKLFKASTAFITVSCFLLSFVVVAAIATWRDFFFPEHNLREISFWSLMNCFSLKRNVKTLLSLSRPSDDIECIHGIRMINALMLVLSHKSMALFFMPYSNRTSMVENLNQQWTVIARVASLYTDSFIMISGLLSSYSMVGSFQKGSLNLKYEYISRLIRLSNTVDSALLGQISRNGNQTMNYIVNLIVPPLAAIILVCTFILPEVGSGPQWNLTVSHHAEKCRKTWWKNFLFIHNYLGFENMCLTHTHHLGIDTQLFFVSPFLVYSLYKWRNYGMGILAGIAILSTIARNRVTAERNLSFFIYPGISVEQMFDTANYSYIIPFHRLTVYIMGIFLGYVLRLFRKNNKIKSHLLSFGWTVTFCFLSYVLTKGNEMNNPDYVYNNQDAATYAALAPVAWCLFIGWLTFVSHIGCGGYLGKILSSNYWLIWTRLSYAVYLTQFPIFFLNVGLQKYSQQYSVFLLVNVLEYVSIIVASIVLTLLFDMPFGNLKKLLLPK